MLTASVRVRQARNLRVSVIRGDGIHRRLPVLAHSLVGTVEPTYWRKTVVTGPMGSTLVQLRLRMPSRAIRKGVRYAIRVRAVGADGIQTVYLSFRG
jgi:hypothetical protein